MRNTLIRTIPRVATMTYLRRHYLANLETRQPSLNRKASLNLTLRITDLRKGITPKRFRFIKRILRFGFFDRWIRCGGGGARTEVGHQ